MWAGSQFHIGHVSENLSTISDHEWICADAYSVDSFREAGSENPREPAADTPETRGTASNYIEKTFNSRFIAIEES